jgi:hypothetical protein
MKNVNSGKAKRNTLNMEPLKPAREPLKMIDISSRPIRSTDVQGTDPDLKLTLNAFVEMQPNLHYLAEQGYARTPDVRWTQLLNITRMQLFCKMLVGTYNEAKRMLHLQ